MIVDLIGDQCTGCGLCIQACAAGALRPAPALPGGPPLAWDATRCEFCGECVEVCPVPLPVAAEAGGELLTGSDVGAGWGNW